MECIGNERDGDDRGAELEQAADNHDTPGPEQFFKRELEADREEQEDNPYFPERTDQRLVGDDGKALGSRQHAYDEETYNAGYFEELADIEEHYRERNDADKGKHEIHYPSPPAARPG